MATKDAINPEDLTGVSLIMVKRELVRNELASWFGDYYEGIQIAAMTECGIGIVLCFDLGVAFMRTYALFHLIQY